MVDQERIDGILHHSRDVLKLRLDLPECDALGHLGALVMNPQSYNLACTFYLSVRPDHYQKHLQVYSSTVGVQKVLKLN